MSIPSLSELCFTVINNTENFILLNGDAIKKLPIEVIQQLLSSMVFSIQSRLSKNTIPLKIKLIRQNRLVTFKLKHHAKVSETVQEIFLKTGGGSSVNDTVENYGLFFRGNENKPSKWLRENNTLSYYDLKPGEVLEFKIKQNLIKVQFLGPWPTVKTFIVDESKTVGELAIEIGEKIGLKNPEELSLQIREYSHNSASSFVWLSPTLSLSEQTVDFALSTLVLRRKYFFRDFSVNEVIGSESLTRSFAQCLDAILSGTNPCTIEDAVKFAALQCQIRFGDCDVDNSFFENLPWEEYFPFEYVPHYRKIEKDVQREYKELSGTSEISAKYRYLQMSKSLKTWGYTFFPAEKIVKDQTQQVLIGISKGNILILESATKETISRNPLYEIVQWKVLHNTLWINYSDHTDEFRSKKIDSISQALGDYINFMVENDRPSRPGSPQSPNLSRSPNSSFLGGMTNGPSLKERENILKKVKRHRRPSIYFGDSTTNFPNPLAKRCPVYVEPSKVTINPLFTEGMTNQNSHLNDQFNYFLKILRSLSCLKIYLGNQSSHEREIRVKFPDTSMKEFIVDECKPVCDIAYEIGEKLGIKNPEEFSLCSENHEVWLNPYQSLKGQLTGNQSLVFKKKFHYHDAFVSSSDPVYFNMLFCQSHEAIVSGLYPCTLDEAVQLAATQFQINFGDHNPSIHKPGFLKISDLKFFLPPDWLEKWGMTFQKLEKQIYKEHTKLRGIKEEYAKFRYLQLCRNLTTYGTVFFQVKLEKHMGSTHVQLPSTPILLGFSRDSISFLTTKKKLLVEYPFSHLRKWEGTSEYLKLDFADYQEGYFVFLTSEGEAISKYLSDYLDFIQKNVMATHTFNTQLLEYPPRNADKNFFLSESNWVCCWENGKRVFTSTFWDDAV